MMVVSGFVTPFSHSRKTFNSFVHTVGNSIIFDFRMHRINNITIVQVRHCGANLKHHPGTTEGGRVGEQHNSG